MIIAQKKIAKTAPEDKCFITIDGARIASIIDLAKDMDHMNDDVFYYHVTETKNDFANWIRHVFHEEKLARDLLALRRKEETQIKLLKYLLGYK